MENKVFCKGKFSFAQRGSKLQLHVSYLEFLGQWRDLPGSPQENSVRSLGGSSLEVGGQLPWDVLVSLQAEDSAAT